MTEDLNVLALVKGEERYIFLYDETSRAETLRILGRYASCPELSFSWYDAAVLSQKIRQLRSEPTPKYILWKGLLATGAPRVIHEPGVSPRSMRIIRTIRQAGSSAERSPKLSPSQAAKLAGH